MLKRTVRNAGMLTLLLALFASSAAAEEVTLADVITRTVARHPDLAISRLNSDITATEIERIEGMLDPSFSVNAGYSDETTPVTSPFAPEQTSLAHLTGSITKPLANGSSLTGSLSYNRTSLGYGAGIPLAFQSSPNPAYQHQIDVIYRYPLLRGHGNPEYHQQSLAARQDVEGAKWQTAMTGEQLAAQAINLFYQLAADEISLKLARDAVKRARQLLAYQKLREQFGLIETADRLQAEALLATRRMEETRAESNVEQDRTALHRLMLEEPATPLSARITNIAADMAGMPSLEALLAEAEEKRPVFRMLAARLEASDARLTAARDRHDTQVDLVGQVGSRALSGSAGTALANGFTLNDRYVAISIELSDTIGGRTTGAAIRKAELSRQQVLLQRQQSLEDTKSFLAEALTRLQTGMATLIAAESRADAEKRKFEAEMRRYRQGRSDTATIVQFEGELRAAELQAALQRISVGMARSQLELGRGDLMPRIDRRMSGN